MNPLIQEITTSAGYFERPAVWLQLLVVSLPLLVGNAIRHWRGGPAGLADRHRQIALGLALLGVLALRLVGIPHGFSMFLLALVLGWEALAPLERLLARFLHPEPRAQLMSRLIRPFYLLAAGVALLDQLQNVRDLAQLPLTLFGGDISVGQLFIALLLAYLLLVGSGPPAAGLAWLARRTLGLTQSSQRAMALIFRYTVVGLGLLLVVSNLGLNTTALVAVAGGLSVGLGFGIKEVFSNFVSGLWLLFEGSVRPGEVLMVDGDPCEVRSLGLRAAVLWRDRDNAELVVPNQTFFTESTVTYTRSDRLRRSELSVGAAYRHNPEQVIPLLEAAARGVAGVLPDPPARAFLVGYGDSAINYSLRFWIADPMRNLSVRDAVGRAIWATFASHGIEIPFPQRVVHRPAGRPATDPPSGSGAGRGEAANPASGDP
ncbi:MAG: mechanosensitive ion channel domain-containing protein [Synechococcaceae cyanobacterium]